MDTAHHLNRTFWPDTLGAHARKHPVVVSGLVVAPHPAGFALMMTLVRRWAEAMGHDKHGHRSVRPVCMPL